jgi:hypothetical protein
MRRAFLFAMIFLAGCGSRETAPANKQQAQPEATARSGHAPQAAPADRANDGAGAADMLRHYYGLIQAGKYDQAWKMRVGGGVDAERFAANFKAYEHYEATVGQPSLPASQGGWDYVEVPVMITGRFVGGKPFGSAGSVSLRRARQGGDRSWRIYTGG